MVGESDLTVVRRIRQYSGLIAKVKRSYSSVFQRSASSPIFGGVGCLNFDGREDENIFILFFFSEFG